MNYTIPRLFKIWDDWSIFTKVKAYIKKKVKTDRQQTNTSLLNHDDMVT